MLIWSHLVNEEKEVCFNQNKLQQTRVCSVKRWPLWLVLWSCDTPVWQRTAGGCSSKPWRGRGGQDRRQTDRWCTSEKRKISQSTSPSSWSLPPPDHNCSSPTGGAPSTPENTAKTLQPQGGASCSPGIVCCTPSGCCNGHKTGWPETPEIRFLMETTRERRAECEIHGNSWFTWTQPTNDTNTPEHNQQTTQTHLNTTNERYKHTWTQPTNDTNTPEHNQWTTQIHNCILLFSLALHKVWKQMELLARLQLYSYL